MDSRFGTAITCIDGRIQEPVAAWLKGKYLLDFVDVISEPGVDRVLATEPPAAQEHLRDEVQLSVERHGSTVVAVVAHHDCASNPGTREEHVTQLRRALEIVRSWGFSSTVEALWVNERWEVEAVG